MAEIHAEPRGRGGASWWWLWLIVALVVIFFIWVFAWPWGGRTTVSQNAGYANRTATDPFTATITDPAALISSNDRLGMVGNRVDFTNVQVTDVASDGTFWVGRPGNDVFVVWSEAPGKTAAGGSNIHPGAAVNVTGTVQPLPPANQHHSGWNLTEKQSTRLDSQQVYVYASSVTPAGRPATGGE